MMDISSAARLTELFRNEAENRRIDRKQICLSVPMDNGAEMTIHVNSPYQAAEYLKFLLENKNPLFQRGMKIFSFGPMNDPIVFKAWGTYRDPDARKEYAVMSVRLRFFRVNDPSELCFDDDFCRTDWESPGNRTYGPKIQEFIRALERAGSNWHDLAFTTPSPRFRQKPRLTLIHNNTP